MNTLDRSLAITPAVADDVSRRTPPGRAGESTNARTDVRGYPWRGFPGRALLGLLLLIVGSPWARAAETSSAEPVYLRRSADTNGLLSLEVAARELVPVKKNRPPVWLVGVIHLGTSDYYAGLQTFLDQQSLVLFEGIGAAEGNFELQDDEFSLQDRMAAALGLMFQLEAIDYDRPTFQNSDLGFEELARLFAGQPAGEDDGSGSAAPGGAEFTMLMQMMRGQGFFGGIARLGVTALAASPRLQATTKVMLIEMMGGLPSNLAEIAGMPEGMQQLMEKLIKARNDVVVGDVRRELRKRRRPETLAVFYGAGHMADLEDRLCKELKLHPGREQWFTALSIDPAAAGLSSFEVGLARSMARLQLSALGNESSKKDAGCEAEKDEPAGQNAD